MTPSEITHSLPNMTTTPSKRKRTHEVRGFTLEDIEREIEPKSKRRKIQVDESSRDEIVRRKVSRQYVSLPFLNRQKEEVQLPELTHKKGKCK